MEEIWKEIPKYNGRYHINNVPTDNRLENLRIVTNRENCTKDRKTRSEYYNIYTNRGGSWYVLVNHKGKRHWLGTFDGIKDAIKARDKLKIEVDVED